MCCVSSVNLADDAELCQLMVEADFKKIFVGIETPSAESFEEFHKLQNCSRDLVAAVKTLQHSGMEVMGGFIIDLLWHARGHWRDLRSKPAGGSA